MMSVEEAKARLCLLGEEVDARRDAKRSNFASPALIAGVAAVAGALLMGRRKKTAAKSMVTLMLLGRLLRPALPALTRTALRGIAGRHGRA